MTADDIAAALRGNPPLSRLHELQAACESRRIAIRARLEAIVEPDSDVLPTPKARHEARLEGLAAVAELDREVDDLRREFALLDDLEGVAIQQLDARTAAAARAAAPAAQRKLPAACQRVRDALAALDAAIGAVDALVAPLAGVATLAGESFPLSDAELAELLRLRDEVWRPRATAVLIPPPDRPYPLSTALYFETRGGAVDRTITVRRRPGTAYLPDLVGSI